MNAESELDVVRSIELIKGELADLLERMVGSTDDSARSMTVAAETLVRARRVFVHGAGRSGLALRMVAMRLMHLGLIVHVVGDSTTPAIRSGDVLLTASGSGTTAGVVRIARAAVTAGADVVAATAVAGSSLTDLAAVTIVIPAAQKLDRSDAVSAQYAGSLFEQGVVAIGDALFDALQRRSHETTAELWARHANLE
ncbi:6-phospho-3-hexuloisomerase [Microbacterium sp. NPDC089695]|uniref:6-phospho-3-hexuloisomerase n=1 Tax=Microbacterium sp. NPDC089695 TaxID=3364198 RepID=UPI003807AC9E